MSDQPLKYKSNLKLRCYTFGLNVINLIDTLPNKRSSWVIADQLVRSATSIGANLIEAKASSSRLEFKRFHEISLKSANEAKYWLELLKDSKLSDSNKIDPLLKEVTEIGNMIASGVLKLKGKNF
ncbi:MAG: four helix bundle protein [Candidatus Pacebacteria bacterium]|nr:four helix bundle protein [Candidatus Paceibacterota bacterium]